MTNLFMNDAKQNNDWRPSIVIPVLNAERYLPELLRACFDQRPVRPVEVILVDSMSTDRTREIAATFKDVRVIPITNFSHGRSRNMGARAANGNVIVLLTQDALPKDDTWLQRLLAPLSDERVVASFSRQEPRPEASPMERYFLQTHFPAGDAPVVSAKKAGEQLQFQRDVFFSNVSAAIRRDVLLRFPFDEDLIMSEDQQFARDVLEKGYGIAYQPQSVVIHSHQYTLAVVFKRYFDSVYSVTKLFANHGVQDSAVMGLKYLWGEFLFVCRRHFLWLPYYLCYTAAKASGTLAGHFAEYWPTWLRRKMSLHSYHWNTTKAKGH